ncbi:hypothetical protein [Micromonospora mirobrigensis]|uniref:Flagellar basal body-associated protein FliL n=1 Tax=Micromonospora mirobrigensis TaxID=262898 RepID=A0A1C5A1S0_9ACTN|nr:hypothetical protein [Micromonospora mirobrigensis]SCF39133.1 hypothetical protein GA0070564_107178 [Micromonospora mirobrigensis]
MSSPPVDPWSRQPAHPAVHGQPPEPAAADDWPTAAYPGVPVPHAGEDPTAAYPGVPGGDPTAAYPAVPGPPGAGHTAAYPAVSGPPGAGHTAAYPGAGAPTGAPWGPPAGPGPGSAYPPPVGGFPPAPAYPPAPQHGYGPAPVPPARGSRLPLVLSLSLAGLLVLCLGGGGLAYVTLSGDDDKPGSARPAATGAASPGTTRPTPSTDDEEPEGDSSFPRIRLVTPKTLSGRPKSSDPQLRALAADMVSEMRSTVRNQTGTVGAFYGSPEQRNMVMVAAASGLILDPGKEMTDAVTALTRDLSLTGMTRVAPGPLGGKARCGNGSGSGVRMGVCVWADTGSTGVLIFFFSDAAKAEAQFVKVRGQIEKQA